MAIIRSIPRKSCQKSWPYIRHRLLEQGLWRESEHRPGLIEGLPLCTVVDTRECLSDKLKADPAFTRLDRRVFLKKTFNVTEIHRQYENYPFATQFSLERFSIREMGLRHMIKGSGMLVNQAYRETASVPLPGHVEKQDGQQEIHVLPIGDNERKSPPYIVDHLPQHSRYYFNLFRRVVAEKRKEGRGLHFDVETL